jgi:NADH-quinone oxidoreductase subunit L
MALHAVQTLPFWLMVLGATLVWAAYARWPAVPAQIARWLGGVYTMLQNNYYFDRFNEIVFAGGARLLGNGLWKIGDVRLIDGLAINGSAKLVGWIAGTSRWLQSGYIYHYAFGMIIGVLALISLFLTYRPG